MGRRLRTGQGAGKCVHTKDRGDLTEMEFMVEAKRRGYPVGKPFGDNQHYDVLLDAVVVEDELEAGFVYGEGRGFSGGADRWEGDLVFDSGAGVGREKDDSSLSVWEPEGWEEAV